MFASLKNFLKRLRPEDPRRIHEFREKLMPLCWDSQSVVKSLSAVFYAVDDLAEAEVQYYYRRRGTRAWVSGITRLAAWVLGSVGLLLPLLAGTGSDLFKDWGQFGYVAIAGAASCLAANSLFGGTSGHVRFVSTQLELERLTTAARIEWCAFLAEANADAASIKKGFDLILAFANGLHTSTLAETGHWGEIALAELAKYQSSIEAKGTSKGK
jgi:hypothetical protein